MLPRNFMKPFVIMATLLLSPALGATQSLIDLKPASEPLVLSEQGSFFVGGRTIHASNTGMDEIRDQLKGAFEQGDILIDQMYVQFQKPVNPAHLPIVFMHGCCLTSKTWETTPDGRMGWYEYFAREGFPTYMAEQTGRGRSGFNATTFNEVRAGLRSAVEQPRTMLATAEFAWAIFRFGPKFGEAWPDLQFPVDRVGELYKQVVPDTILTQVPSLRQEFTNITTRNPTVDNLASLASELNGAILVGHSESSGFPAQALMKGKGGIRGIIQIETGCFNNLTTEQAKLLATVPVLVVVGDYNGPNPSAVCAKEMQQVKAAGGDIDFISLPDIGIKGNSHMMMQDKNNQQVADVLIKWINDHVEK